MDQRIIYVGSIWEYLELDKKKTKDPDKYKSFEIIYDLNKIRKEVNGMADQEKNEKKFTKEVKIVEEYIEKHPGVSYREAVLASLDMTEPETKKEFTEEQKEDIKREKENLEKIEKYISENPKVEYRTAILTVLGKDELNESERKVEEFIQKRRSRGIEISYREAVLAVLDKSEPGPKKEE